MYNLGEFAMAEFAETAHIDDGNVAVYYQAAIVELRSSGRNASAHFTLHVNDRETATMFREKWIAYLQDRSSEKTQPTVFLVIKE